MKRYDIINTFIQRYNYQFYLEIGYQNGVCFDHVNCKNKEAVDPNPQKVDRRLYQMTSDQYFQMAKERGWKFDIVFIDGLHHADQVYKDIHNALDLLNPNGTIICHDMNPTSEEMQKVPRETKAWTGDCWKALVKIRSEENNLAVFTVDTDMGCGVITKTKESITSLPIKENEITYQNFAKFKVIWLNLISINQFKEVFAIKSDFRLWEITPYGLDGDYGNACNDMVSKFDDEDWIIITDSDFMFLTPKHHHVIAEIIKQNPEVGLFTCRTNRVKQKKQIVQKLFSDPDVRNHRKEALRRVRNRKMELTELDIVISGYVMIFQKKVWEEVGGFKSGILSVDNNFSKKILKSGRKIMLMEGIYGFHYYRFLEGINNKDHLK